MKPNFALSLSFEGIDLLHRAPDGWRAVGHVSFEDPNLSSAITELREQSQTLAPEGVTSKLILPQNQVKFLTLPLGGTRPAGYRALAENALEGATPYPLQDLAIDWRADGATLHVAAVAKETLAEAEGFAQEHDFNPVSFTAEPTSDFPGEPFFGATETATALLSGPVTPDDDATAVIGPAIFQAQRRNRSARLKLPSWTPPKRRGRLWQLPLPTQTLRRLITHNWPSTLRTS